MNRGEKSTTILLELFMIGMIRRLAFIIGARNGGSALEHTIALKMEPS